MRKKQYCWVEEWVHQSQEAETFTFAPSFPWGPSSPGGPGGPCKQTNKQPNKLKSQHGLDGTYNLLLKVLSCMSAYSAREKQAIRVGCSALATKLVHLGSIFQVFLSEKSREHRLERPLAMLNEQWKNWDIVYNVYKMRGVMKKFSPHVCTVWPAWSLRPSESNDDKQADIWLSCHAKKTPHADPPRRPHFSSQSAAAGLSLGVFPIEKYKPSQLQLSSSLAGWHNLIGLN